MNDRIYIRTIFFYNISIKFQNILGYKKDSDILDSYLNIAKKVLQSVQCPMHSKQILEYAYLNDMVPKHLFGKTQHKTLQARLSSDILFSGRRSLFYRTEPGVFFLIQFLNDDNIPQAYKNVFHARRRERELRDKPVLTIDKEALKVFVKKDNTVEIRNIENFFSFNNIKYLPYNKAQNESNFIVWSFVVFYREHEVLSYRQGRYREGRDAFVNRQTIGFPFLLTDEDRGLFDQKDHGLTYGGLSKAVLDLGIPVEEFDFSELKSRLRLDSFFVFEKNGKAPEFLGLVTFNCPKWFEPTANKLAINDLRWVDIRKPINHIDDYDPWSQKIIGYLKDLLNKSIA